MIFPGWTYLNAAPADRQQTAAIIEAGRPDRAQMQNALPVRILTCDEIADAAEWLVSDEAQ